MSKTIWGTVYMCMCMYMYSQTCAWWSLYRAVTCLFKFQVAKLHTLHTFIDKWFLIVPTPEVKPKWFPNYILCSICRTVQHSAYTLYYIALSKNKGIRLVHVPTYAMYVRNTASYFFQTAKKDLLTLDFEGILNYFRVSLPKRFQTEQQCQHLFHALRGFKVKC